MISRRFWMLAVLAAAFFTASMVEGATPEKRVALVIGNADYPNARLANPVNDATDVAALLERLGFEVILKKDAGKRVIEQAVEDFKRRLRNSHAGLTGHGLQLDG